MPHRPLRTSNLVSDGDHQCRDRCRDHQWPQTGRHLDGFALISMMMLERRTGGHRVSCTSLFTTDTGHHVSPRTRDTPCPWCRHDLSDDVAEHAHCAEAQRARVARQRQYVRDADMVIRAMSQLAAQGGETAAPEHIQAVFRDLLCEFRQQADCTAEFAAETDGSMLAAFRLGMSLAGMQTRLRLAQHLGLSATGTPSLRAADHRASSVSFTSSSASIGHRRFCAPQDRARQILGPLGTSRASHAYARRRHR
jgi:hypothetical protein